MTTRIELGSFNRNEDSPIMLKEKIEIDGRSSVRIYQRKDIDSITSFKDRIKTMMKYGIEDFCIKHETFRPLLQSVGVKRINRLQTDNPKSTQDLFQSLRSEARTGTVTQKTEGKLKEILGNHGLPEDYQIDFYPGKYKTEDFFSDLKKFLNSGDNFSDNCLFFIKKTEDIFTSKTILHKSTIKDFDRDIDIIKNSVNTHFETKTRFLAAQLDERTKLSKTNFSESMPPDLKNFQIAIQEKLDEIKNEINKRSITPTNEDIKKYLLSLLEKKFGAEEDSERWDDETATAAANIRAAIKTLFSTNWWISEERKMESLEKVKIFFTSKKEQMPEAVANRIYQE